MFRHVYAWGRHCESYHNEFWPTSWVLADGINRANFDVHWLLRFWLTRVQSWGFPARKAFGPYHIAIRYPDDMWTVSAKCMVTSIYIVYALIMHYILGHSFSWMQAIHILHISTVRFPWRNVTVEPSFTMGLTDVTSLFYFPPGFCWGRDCTMTCQW